MCVSSDNSVNITQLIVNPNFVIYMPLVKLELVVFSMLYLVLISFQPVTHTGNFNFN